MASTCQRDRGGEVSLHRDACPGGGAARVLVRVSPEATCDSVRAALALSSPDVRLASPFAGAPREIRDRFCVFTSATNDATVVSRVLASACAWEPIELATHDCSSTLVPSSEPDAYVSPEGTVATGGAAAGETLAGPWDTLTVGEPFPCDACATVIGTTMYVALPPEMVTTTSTTIYARFLNSSLPDVAITPPVGAQTFTVPNVHAPNDASVRVYGPGAVLPPK